MIRTYSELVNLPTYQDRLKYLQLSSRVGDETFGFERYLNQSFYKSREWRHCRDQIITRDLGCDLALSGYEIYGIIYIHHMNPITVNDILDVSDFLLNPEFLVCVSHSTHNLIHFGDIHRPDIFVPRKPNDTCPWKK